MIKRYELLKNDTIKRGDVTLYRIRALTNIKRRWGVIAKAGDLGGYIAEEKNLAQDGDGWIFEKGVIMGGEIRGGEIWGGVIMGGEIRGGEIWGGEIWGGVIMGGEIRGGVIWGGEIWGGVIMGGVIRGGVIWGSGDIFLVQNIGSGHSRVMLVVNDGKGGVFVNAGCFWGTEKEFLAAVKAKHRNTAAGKQYRMIMKLAKERIHGGK